MTVINCYKEHSRPFWIQTQNPLSYPAPINNIIVVMASLKLNLCAANNDRHNESKGYDSLYERNKSIALYK